MPVVKPDEYELNEDQREWPLVWVVNRFSALPPKRERPDVTDGVLELAFGEGKSRKIKSWGHVGEDQAHWLVTRGGTPMHTDPAYLRYTHHLILRNDGWRLRGFKDDEHADPLTVGVMYCLDAHSPHQVVPDPRLAFPGKPGYKVQAAVDKGEPLEPDECWAILAPMLTRDLREGAEAAAKAAAAPKPGAGSAEDARVLG